MRGTLKPIRMPLQRRLMLWRQRALPLLAWAGAVALLVFFFNRQERIAERVMGVVEAREAAVTPPADAAIAQVNVDLFDEVIAGQVVARLDDTPLQVELRNAEAEMNRVQAELTAAFGALEALDAERQAELRRFQDAAEQAKVEYLALQATVEFDRGTIDQLSHRGAAENSLAREGVGDTFTAQQTMLEAAAVEARLRETQKALAEAKRRSEETQQRLDAQIARLGELDSEAELAPYIEAVSVQQAIIDGINVLRDQYTLRAPISGCVSSIFQHAGETVTIGTPLLTITDPEGRRILAYVDERQHADVRVGDDVEIASQANPSLLVTARVLDKGPRVELFPEHLWTRLGAPWGQAILIGELPENLFRPGEAVTIGLRPRL